MKLNDVFLVLLAVTIWGINPAVAKLGLAQIPPLLFTAIRFALVAAVLVPFYRIPKGTAGRVFLLSSVLGVAHFGLTFLGLKGLDAAATIIAIQLSVPFSSLLAAILYRERLGAMEGAGLVLAFAGVALLAGEPRTADPFALGLVVIGAFAWALSNALVKGLAGVSPVALNGWVALFATPQIMLFSLLVEDGQWAAVRTADWIGWGAIAYTTVLSSLVAYTLWYKLIGRHPFNQVMPFQLLAPVIGIAASVLMLGEPLTWQRLVGGGAAIAGVAIIQLRPKPKAKLV